MVEVVVLASFHQPVAAVKVFRALQALQA